MSPHQPGATRPARCGCDLGGEQRGAALGARRAPSSAALPPGPGAQVEPALVGALERARRPARARPAGCPRPAPRPARRAPRRCHRGRRRAAPRRTATSGRARLPPRRSSATVARPGRATRVTCGGTLSAASSAAVSSSVAAERVAQRRDDPAGVRVDDREVPDRVGRRTAGATSASQASRSCRPTRRSTALTNEPRPSPATARASSTVAPTAACAGTRVAEQLVGAEPEHVEHRRVDLVQRPVDAGGEHRVVRALRRAACRRRARWRTPRPGRVQAALAQQARAASGWRRRPARRRPAAGRRRPGGAASGRRLGAARVAACLAGPGRAGHPSVAAVEVADAAGPVGRRHRPLARPGAPRRAARRGRRRCRPAPRAGRPATSPGASSVGPGRLDRAEAEPVAGQGGPGAGRRGAGADQPVDAERRRASSRRGRPRR